MEPTLFNLYTCAVVEGWLERVKHIKGAGTLVFCKFDQKSLRRSEKGATKEFLSECQFADDISFLATTRAAAEEVTREYQAIANASKAFGALRQSVFSDKILTINTKRRIYQACVLSVLLYGSECWTPLRRHLRRLGAFHHRCIRTVLGITNGQQWEEHYFLGGGMREMG